MPNNKQGNVGTAVPRIVMRVITGDGQFGSAPMVKNITTRKKRAVSTKTGDGSSIPRFMSITNGPRERHNLFRKRDFFAVYFEMKHTDFGR